MIEDVLFDILRPWLLKATGLDDVIVSHPDAPPPPGTYASVNFIHTHNLHRPLGMNHEQDDDEIDAEYTGLQQVPVYEVEWTASINIYARNAMDIGRRISDWAESDAADLLLYPLTTQPVTSVRRIPEYVEGKWIGRAQLDLNVRGIVNDGTLIDGDGNKVVVGRVPVNEIVEGTVTIGPYENPDFASGDYERP